ncbi:MAG: hypothetical protein IPM63_18630 [Acidobacteriota bacterium]|nr:MAG: hypothetical protein IPM63_18630 [Acidobacteriota bacterium]
MERNSVGINMIWAITILLIVAMLAGAVYYSGFLSNAGDKEIDVNVSVPATNSQ